jgi:hypothetical protein
MPRKKKLCQLLTRFGTAPTCVSVRWIKKVSDVKGNQSINNPKTIRKHEAVRTWCRKRGMRFVVITK